LPVDVYLLTNYCKTVPLESFPIIALWEAIKKTFKGHSYWKAFKDIWVA